MATLSQRAGEAECGLRFGFGEHRGGLVEDQDFRAAEQHFHDFQLLLVGDRELVDAVTRVEMESEPRAQGFHRLQGLGLVLPAGAARAGEAEIFDYRKRTDQFEMLVDHADSGIGGGGRVLIARRLAVDLHGAGIGGVEAREHIHQRRFAGAVFAEQSVYLAPGEGEIHALQRRPAAEGFFDASKPNGDAHAPPP